MAAVIGHRLESNLRYVGRIGGLEPDIVRPAPELRFEATSADIAWYAARAFAAMDREPQLDHLELDLPSVDEAIAAIQARMSVEATSEFEILVAGCERPVEVVAYFLALLELVRWGALRVSQDDERGPIRVERLDGSFQAEIEALTSEWGAA